MSTPTPTINTPQQAAAAEQELLQQPPPFAWVTLVAAERTRLEQLDAALREYQERCARERRRRERLRAAGVQLVDQVEAALVASELRATSALVAVEQWFKHRRRPWLVLSGPTGCGKSVSAAAVVAQVDSAAWIRADELARVFASSHSSLHAVQQQVRSCTLLIVDDLGTEPDAARMTEVLGVLADARMSARRRPTIVTTNIVKPRFLERYSDPRLHSRFAELADWQALVGPDLRREP